jgi:hypothetical protein
VATHPTIAFRALKTLSGMAVPRQEFPEAATQTFKAGAPVVLQAGYLQECGANPPLIMGIASKDGQSGASAGAKAQVVFLARPGEDVRDHEVRERRQVERRHGQGGGRNPSRGDLGPVGRGDLGNNGIGNAAGVDGYRSARRLLVRSAVLPGSSDFVRGHESCQ